MEKRSFGLYTTVSVVIANMIGTGVFTSLGFQVLGIHSGFAIIVLWLIGGVASLLGALVYAEIGSAIPESGGEYTYLSKIYHPSVGFLAGWISFLVGFAAPVAAASIAFSSYLTKSVHFVEIFPFLKDFPLVSTFAISIIVITTLFHAINKNAGAAFQNFFTTFKIIIILFLIAAGLIYGNVSDISFAPSHLAWKDIMSPAFVISLYFVSYSYSGWNAAAYFAGEIKNPKKNIPLSFFIGTFLVSGLYVLLNFVFLKTVPISELAGQVEVGFLFAAKIWGAKIGGIMGLIISFLLVSSISSMVLAGPRVTSAIGDDISFFKWFAGKNKNNVPTRAIIVQSLLSIVYVLTSSFSQMITFIGFTLNLFTMMTVTGVIVYRLRQPKVERPYRTFGYPVTPVLFMIINLWILVYGLIYKPQESIAGLGCTLVGLIVYFIGNRFSKIPKSV
jgi:APA family basic amino acid/polyamine antiporter